MDWHWWMLHAWIHLGMEKDGVWPALLVRPPRTMFVCLPVNSSFGHDKNQRTIAEDLKGDPYNN